MEQKHYKLISEHFEEVKVNVDNLNVKVQSVEDEKMPKTQEHIKKVTQGKVLLNKLIYQ